MAVFCCFVWFGFLLFLSRQEWHMHLDAFRTPGYSRHLPLVSNNENQAFNLAKHSMMTDSDDLSAKFSFRLSTLQNASCAEEEILALQKFERSPPSCWRWGVFRRRRLWERMAAERFERYLGILSPSESPESFILLQEDLDSFTFYLFERRFGWSEYNANLDDHHSVADEHLGRRGSSCSLRIQDESKFKGRLNELLDEFLKW